MTHFKFFGNGQACISPNRVFVHSSIYDEFAARLTASVRNFKTGDGFEKGM